MLPCSHSLATWVTQLDLGVHSIICQYNNAFYAALYAAKETVIAWLIVLSWHFLGGQ